MTAFAIWLTGLPGSGKSAIARELLVRLHARAVDPAVLESDVMRTQLTPRARYDEQERAFFYGCLTAFAQVIVLKGRPVLIDATANRRAYRDAARAAIARFAEVYVDTPPEVCEGRDPKGLYRAAKAGEVETLPGPQAAYEAPLAPALIVSGARGTPGDSAAEVIALLERCGWLAARPAGAGTG